MQKSGLVLKIYFLIKNEWRNKSASNFQQQQKRWYKSG